MNSNMQPHYREFASRKQRKVNHTFNLQCYMGNMKNTKQTNKQTKVQRRPKQKSKMTHTHFSEGSKRRISGRNGHPQKKYPIKNAYNYGTVNALDRHACHMSTHSCKLAPIWVIS